MILVDANLLIYAVNQDMPQHQLARRWWEQTLSSGNAVGLPWYEIVWDVVTNKVPALRSKVEQILRQEGTDTC